MPNSVGKRQSTGSRSFQAYIIWFKSSSLHNLKSSHCIHIDSLLFLLNEAKHALITQRVHQNELSVFRTFFHSHQKKDQEIKSHTCGFWDGRMITTHMTSKAIPPSPFLFFPTQWRHKPLSLSSSSEKSHRCAGYSTGF